MKITILNTVSFTVEMTAGDVLDLPAEWADRLLRGGNAEAVVEPVAVVEDEAVEPEPHKKATSKKGK